MWFRKRPFKFATCKIMKKDTIKFFMFCTAFIAMGISYLRDYLPWEFRATIFWLLSFIFIILFVKLMRAKR
ncbi:hypothetical protein CW740_01350 [Kangiella profundi]|uniref:Uncharacterized protein n=1 Tax=Kangiella profundi TaxID=1561924 RepID=A0A2K9AC48_9GAMM|nr:hypothetical protein CW740_01350 [Kangiella profundi]